MPARSLRTVVTLIVGLFAGCATAPVQEMSNARQALDAARLVGAETRAPESYQQAEALLKKAEEDLAAHDYGNARDNADAARDAAIKARAESQQKTTP